MLPKEEQEHGPKKGAKIGARDLGLARGAPEITGRGVLRPNKIMEGEEAIKLAAELRKNGISVIGAIGNKSLKAQLRQSSTIGTHYTVIIGEQEVKTGTVILRDMNTAEQKTISPNELQNLLR